MTKKKEDNWLKKGNDISEILTEKKLINLINLNTSAYMI